MFSHISLFAFHDYILPACNRQPHPPPITVDEGTAARLRLPLGISNLQHGY